MVATRQDISVYPEDLFNSGDVQFGDDGNGNAYSEQHLWVLYTKARHEKALARRAVQCGVPFFLPLIKQMKYSRGYRYSVHAPLFPGYFFLFGNDEQRVWSLTTSHVSRVLTVPEPGRLFADLARIHHLTGTEAIVTPERRLEPGRPVRVSAGPLFGLEGHVLKRRGETRLLVSVDFLQQGASVEVDDFMLEPID
ncbi:MAG: antitermination protein NusG [candidate division Zixibacteria bacterium]|nr:antitermination protein NusG [candidate division Zixibacteria bacterium]